jgi:hypothetical protein
MYAIQKERSRVRSTTRTGAMQRGGGVRWYVYLDTRRITVPFRYYGAATDGGFFTRKAAEAFISSRGQG